MLEITVKPYCECSIRECFSLESVVIKYCTTGRPGRLKRLPMKFLSAGGRCVKVISWKDANIPQNELINIPFNFIEEFRPKCNLDMHFSGLYS